MLGTLEVCSGIYLSESLSVCAYEAARIGVRRRATADDIAHKLGYDDALGLIGLRLCRARA